MTATTSRTRIAHYLDHAATTPMRAEALAAWTEAAGRVGNPASQHGRGRRARRAVEEARESMADLLDCRPSDLVFTSGGTEADDLAILGQVGARLAADPGRPCIVAVGATEHHSVLDSAVHLATRPGTELVVMPVGPDGAVDPATVADLAGAHGAHLALVATMVVNNEIGSPTDVAGVAAAAHAVGAAVHTDAVQAVGHLPWSFAASGATSASISAHKFGGPMGVGALVLDRGAPCLPRSFGGGQERDLRSGTVDVPAVVAMAAALTAAEAGREAETERLTRLRERLAAGIQAAVPQARRQGPGPGAPAHPGIVSMVFPGCSGESLILLLDAAGVECSTGAACTAGVAEPSHVLLALGADEADARAVLRFSLGHTSTAADVDAAIAAIGAAAERARAAGSGLAEAGRR